MIIKKPCFLNLNPIMSFNFPESKLIFIGTGIRPSSRFLPSVAREPSKTSLDSGIKTALRRPAFPGEVLGKVLSGKALFYCQIIEKHFKELN